MGSRRIETTTQTDFEAHLEHHPDGWEMRLVYADWLEEQGESLLANGQRWQVENGKYSKSWFGHTFINSRYGFAPYAPNSLNESLFVQLPGASSLIFQANHRIEAESALASAIHKLGIVSTCNAIP